MRLDLLILTAIGLSATWAVESFAQTVEGVEAGRLRDAAKAQSKDARAFADEVTRRGEALRMHGQPVPITGKDKGLGDNVLEVD